MPMVGAVIVAHGFIGQELITTAEYIVGKIEAIVAVSLAAEMSLFETRRVIAEAIEEADHGQGVLVLTDLLGGSPSNIAFSFLNRRRIDVITGVNLPMILTFWNKREGRPLGELAKSIQLSGTRSIAIASRLAGAKGVFKQRIPARDRRTSRG
jgi:mannose PTS system EIIA component